MSLSRARLGMSIGVPYPRSTKGFHPSRVGRLHFLRPDAIVDIRLMLLFSPCSAGSIRSALRSHSIPFVSCRSSKIHSWPWVPFPFPFPTPLHLSHPTHAMQTTPSSISKQASNMKGESLIRLLNSLSPTVWNLQAILQIPIDVK